MKSENVMNLNFEKIAFLQRETFISTISHDLKIPILAQIRALELLIDGKMGKLNSCQEEIVNLTLNSCRSMYGMLSEIVSAYKYENKDVVLVFEHINVIKFIEKYFSVLNETVKSKNIKIFIKNESYYPIIKADKFQFEKAFGYLVNFCLSNAVSDSTLNCLVWDSEDNIHITLSFENPYFSQEKLETIFGNLSQNRMDKVGSNLGVHLAKQIVSAHNGSIFSCNKKEWNEYTINLPLINVNNVQ
jgi:signal transduction histidine kinase